MKIYKMICELYTEFFRQVSLNKNFVFVPYSGDTLKDPIIICDFIRWLKADYKEQVDINFLIDFFKFQFSHYAGIKTSYGRNVIMLHWIIGKKAIKRWKERDVRKKWIVRVKLKNDVELKLVHTFKKIQKDNYKNPFLDVQKYEEIDKNRFYNTDKGFQYCLTVTTLFNPKSELCDKCIHSLDCRDILHVNHPKLYTARIDE